MISEEQATTQNSGAPQSKRSRKSFPKWNPGNGLRKPQNDKTFRSIVEEAEASLQQSPATPSGRRESHPVSILVKSCPSEATSPQSSCLFQATSAFQTIYAAGISQRGATRPSQGSRDSATIATRRKSDDLVTQCQKHIFINREEKMEQLERMVLGLRQEVLSLKQKVQRLEAASFKEPELGCQPCEVPEHFNGYTKEQLKEAIRFDQKISTRILQFTLEMSSLVEEKMEQLERMVLGLRQEVLSLKQKVQRLEAASFKEPELGCQPCEVPEHFNGYTKEQLKEAIRFDQKISTACKTLLYKLFTSDYIQSHSITGRRGNTFREAKPMMDERCIKVIRVLLKQRFGDHLSDTVITEKIQNVQKALRQKYKTECL
nr:uncharacterized protein LOC110087849 [Pogona vitticeps]